MAGHGLLPGCQRAWNHDGCPGYLRSPAMPGEPEDEIRMGGVACHCPCHRLTREIELHRQAAELTRTQLAVLEAENLRLVEQAGQMAETIEDLQERLANAGDNADG